MTLKTPVLLTTLTASVLFACSPAPTTPTAPTTPQVTSYTLPGNDVFPEGVATQPGTQFFYVTSTTYGTVFRGTLGTPATEEFLPPGTKDTDGRTTAVGLKADEAGRLYIAGGATGRLFVYNIATKALIRAFETPAVAAGGTFINDVALTPSSAYFTDSVRPILWRVSRDGTGDVEAWLDFTGSAVQYATGFNLNGIAATPGGQYLITVQSNTGKLFRIDTASKAVSEINLGGATVVNGDGILLDGQTLYVVRNADKIIVPITLSADFTAGEIGTPFSDASLKYPTTIAPAGGRLLVVNSQFNRRAPGLTPELPFTVSSVAVPK